ncbi:MAG: FkbM family methyltransferase [Reyranella sp.]|nr:FkbM family methyltransferase [Reyranella sp.]
MLECIICEIDVQGAEFMVLAGMTGRLSEVDALVIETSTIATVKGGTKVHDIVRFLGEHGFFRCCRAAPSAARYGDGAARPAQQCCAAP